jgi:DNA-binding CsgD family transcriptional regulator
MTAAIASVPATVGASRVRIAISSPDILARIRQVFAAKGLAVEIDHLPYVEVTVSRAAGAAPADPSAVGDALHRLAAPAPRATAATGRLCAEYQLNVVKPGDRPRADRPLPAGRRGLAVVPDLDAGDPVGTLSQRQREVLDLVSRGVRNAEIAAQLQVSEKTVKNHINQIFSRLGTRNRVEAVLIWQRHQDRPAEAEAG